MHRRLILPALVLTLAACSAPAEEPTAEAATATTEAAPAAAEATTEEATAAETTTPTDLPSYCADSTRDPETDLGSALMGVDLPEDVAVIAVQEVAPHRDVDQSMGDVVVYLCSRGLTEEEHRSIASDLAAAADASPVADQINRFSVGSYATEGEDPAELERQLKVDDFQLHIWEHGDEDAGLVDAKWDESAG